MSKIQSTCPRCHAVDELGEETLGVQARCKKCGAPFMPRDAYAEVASPSTVAAGTEPKHPANVEARPAAEPNGVHATAPAARKDVAELSASESKIPAIWKPGDIILDLYEVKTVFEGGGMGLVYRVRHRNWNVDLAVKSPRPEFFRTEQHKENFEREAGTWVNLGLHPHTVSCYYVRRLGGIPRIFAEYIEGGSLADWIRDGRLYEGGPEKSLERIVDVAIQFAWGLHYAHEQGLVHQDVKPANVLMTPDRIAKVTDFGLARARTAAAGGASAGVQDILVSSGGMTPAYCSPEQANGEPLSRTTDVWSWAVSILEMFTGEVTWPSGTVAGEALEAYLEMGPPSGRLPQMPTEMADLLKRCFLQSPDERPGSMLEIAERLREVYRQVSGVAHARLAPKAADLRADSLNNRAASLLDLDKEAEAVAAWDEATALDPQHGEAVFNRALVAWDQGEIIDEEVVRRVAGVVAAHPGDARALSLLGRVHLVRGDADTALSALIEAVRDPLLDAETGVALGDAHLAKGSFPEAVKAYQQVLDRWVDHAAARERLALARAGSQRSLFPPAPPVLGLSPDRPPRCLRTFTGHSHFVQAVAVSPDGRFCLSGSNDRTLRLWDLASGACAKVLEGHESMVWSVAFLPDGRHAVSGSCDNTIGFWDLHTGTLVRRLEGHPVRVIKVAISPKGDLLLSRDESGTVRLWKLPDGQLLKSWEQPPGGNVVFVDERTGVWQSSEKALGVWDLASGKLLRSFEGGAGAVDVSRDRRWLLTGSADKASKALLLFDFATGKLLRTLKGHEGEPVSIALSADGRLALSSASNDLLVRLWDVQSGTCLRALEAHASRSFYRWVAGVAFGPDGTWGISAGFDGTVRLWQLQRSAPGDHERAVLSRPRVSAELTSHEAQYRRHIERARQAHDTSDPRLVFQLLTEARSVPGYDRDPAVREVAAATAATFKLARRGLRDGWRLPSWEEKTGPVHALAVAPSGRQVWLGGPTLELWDLASWQRLHRFDGHDMVVRALAISADGRLGLSGAEDKTLCLWDLDTRQCLWKRPTLQEGFQFIHQLAFSPDGQTALVAIGAIIQLWSVSEGKCLQTWTSDDGDVKSVRISADGSRALSGSFDETVRLWDLKSGRCLKTLNGHTGKVLDVAVSPDSSFGLSGSQDETIRLWDLDQGKCLATLRASHGWIESVAFTPDGRHGLSGLTDGTLQVWDLTAGTCLKSLKSDGEGVESLTLTPNGRFAFSFNHTHKLHCWEFDWDFDPDGTTPSLAESYRSRGSVGWHDGVRDIRSVRTLEEHTDEIASVAISGDGRRGLSGSFDGTLRFWDLASEAPPGVWKNPAGPVLGVALSHDGQRALSGGDAPDVFFWDLGGAERRSQLLKGHRGGILAVAFDADARRALSGSHDRTIRLWDLATLRCLQVLEGHQDWISSVAFSPDGTRALSASNDRSVRLWDLTTGKCLKTFTGHTRTAVLSVAFSPDGRMALSAGGDDTIRLWDLVNGTCLRTLTGGCFSAVFSPDGRFALSGGLAANLGGGKFCVWDLASGDCLRVLPDHGDNVVNVALNGDGHWALTGSKDNALRLWEIDWQRYSDETATLAEVYGLETRVRKADPFRPPEPSLADLAGEGPERKKARAIFQEGVRHFDAGDHEAALARFENAVAIDDTFGQAWYYKAWALALLGRFEETAPALDRTLEINPRHEQAWFNKGLFLKNQQQKHEEAIVCFDRVLVLNPSFENAWLDKGVALSDLGRHEEALACYDQALQLNPRYGHALYGKGYSLFQLGRYESALPCFTSYLELQPDDDNSLFFSGRCRYELKDARGAVADFDRVLQRKPAAASAYFQRGRAFHVLELWKEASADNDRVLELTSDIPEAYCNRALCKGMMNDHRGAVEDYDRFLALNPEHMQCYLYRGGRHLDLADYPKARADLERVVALDASQESALRPWIELIARLEQLAARGPSEELALAYCERGWGKYEGAEYLTAVDWFNRALEAKRDHANAWHGRGTARYYLKQYAEAVDDFSRALEIQPDHANSWHMRGLAKGQLGDLDGNIADQSQAIARNPKEASFYWNRADARKRRGDRAGALADYQKTVELRPDFADRLNSTIAELKEQEKSVPAAASSSKSPAVVDAVKTAPATTGEAAAASVERSPGWLNKLQVWWQLRKLRSTSPQTRIQAARKLGLLRNQRALDSLAASLQDADKYVREAAAEALGRIGDPRAIEPLLVAFQDPDRIIESHAVATALGKIGGTRVREFMLGVFAENHDPIDMGFDDRAVELAAIALGEMAEVQARDSLIRYLRAPYPTVRMEAATALGKLGDPTAVPALIEALEDDFWGVRGDAADALGKIADPRAVLPLEQLLSFTEEMMQNYRRSGEIERSRNEAAVKSVALAVLNRLRPGR